MFYTNSYYKNLSRYNCKIVKSLYCRKFVSHPIFLIIMEEQCRMHTRVIWKENLNDWLQGYALE